MLHIFLSTLAQIVDPNEFNIPKVEAGPSQVQNIFSLVFAFAGAISVLMVVIGGLNYVISAGDPQKTARAKDTILYALIGLAVSILAFVIVRFVLGSL